MEALTPPQEKALAYIRESIDRSGIAPTLRELCAHMGYKAIGSAQDVVNALRRKGFLAEADRQSARSLVPKLKKERKLHRVVDRDEVDPNTYVIPCLGSVPAGNPVEAVEERVGTLRMSISLLPKPHPPLKELFGLRAKGESMLGAGILDGDWLIVRVQPEAPQDSVVVARVEGEATVKRLMHDRKQGWFLKPENPSFQPIFANITPFEIVGKVVALQRSVV